MDLTIGAVLKHKGAKMATPVKRWMGPAPLACNICHKPLKHQFVDGATRMGPWAIMCAVCHSEYGCGLGTGRGQRYDVKTLEKVDG